MNRFFKCNNKSIGVGRFLLVLLISYFVSCAGNVFPEIFTLDKESVELYIGDEVQLVATIEPENVTDKSIMWISGNDDIVSISDGVITAKNSGECNVTAICMGLKATCKVTIIDPATLKPKGIFLEYSSLDMERGEQKLLAVDVNIPKDDEKVFFLSSNTQCVEVDDHGVMTAVDVGDATITVSSTDGKYEAKCNVNVRVAVKSISISEENLSFRGYEEKELDVTIYPEDATIKDVTWSSSSPDVVQVDLQGNLKAVALGEAVITVTSKDGQKSASCQCVVERVPAESLYIGEGSIVDVAHNQKIQLPIVLEPADTTDTEIEWISNNENVAEVSDGLITIKSYGEATIFAQVVGTTLAESRKVYIPSALKFESDSSFTITSNEGEGGKTWSDGGVLKHSVNPQTGEWTEWNGDTVSSSLQNDGKHILYMCGLNNTSITGGKRWVINGNNVSCYGDIRSLLSTLDVDKAEMADNCFKNLFAENQSIISPPDLPSTKLSGFCYNSMFKDCTQLATAPSLPATTLKKGCYISMFQGCKSLKQVPALPATTLANNCYGSMFSGCSLLRFSMTKTDECVNEFKLGSKGTASGCFDGIFDGTSGDCAEITSYDKFSGKTLWTSNEVIR